MSQRPEIAVEKGDEARQISRWEHLAKYAVGKYLQTCLQEPRKSFFERFAPYSTQWSVVTDKQWAGEDPLEQMVQIARFWEGVQESPPQILIRSTGHAFTPTSIGHFAHGGPSADDPEKQVVGSIEAITVPLDLAVAALDIDQAEFLVHFMETALGPLSRLHVGHVLTPDELSHRNWAVTLPLTWNVAGVQDVPIGADTTHRLWTTIYSAEVQVEVATWVQYNTPLSAQPFANCFSSEGTSITVPTQVRVGTATPLGVTNRPADARWRVDDRHLARITTRDALYAKRLGRVEVSLISEINPGNDPYATAAVEIVS